MGDVAQLEASFDSGSRVGIQTPSIAGTIERVIVNELPDESALGFQLRTYDDQNVGSELSNILGLSTPIIPPATIDLIDASASQNETITIQVSPGRDDGQEGQAKGISAPQIRGKRRT